MDLQSASGAIDFGFESDVGLTRDAKVCILRFSCPTLRIRRAESVENKPESELVVVEGLFAIFCRSSVGQLAGYYSANAILRFRFFVW